ncbi:MAG: hypothetical protein V4773_26035 [Verrucomicrobiota bacterium]
MSASKKTTAKAAKSPAPATKAAKTTTTKVAVTPAPASAAAPVKAVKKTAAKASAKTVAATKTIIAAVTKAAAAPVIAAKPVAAPVAASAPAPVAAAPAVKEIAPKAVTTTITAKIDVGFGNAVYIRGDGAGLSWDVGLLMTVSGEDVWQVQLGESARPFTFKFLVNDLTWNTGPDLVVASGSNETFTPEF